MQHQGLARNRRGAVAILFGTSALALVMAVGLAIDYSFYIQAQSQLDLAADAGAIHAVRVASTEYLAGTSSSQAAADGSVAGTQWFQAQLGSLATATIGNANVPGAIPPPVVTFDSSTSSFTANINYAGVVPTHFAATFGIKTWPIAGGAQTVVSTLNYSEIVMLIDNSSSMLIGATPTDVAALQNATICAPTATAIAANQSMQSAYSWQFPNWKGYGTFVGCHDNGTGNCKGQGNQKSTNLQTPPTRNDAKDVATRGQCAPQYDGDPSLCPYPADLPAVNDNGFCPTGTGIPDPNGRIDSLTGAVANIPQAPCGFACHTGNGVDDYYTAARSLGSSVQLRYDVVQNAAATVVQTMQSQMQVSNQFTLGVYEFNSTVAQVHPAGGGAEADGDLAAGLTDINSRQPPIVSDQPNTYFPVAIDYLAKTLQPGGDGTNPSSRRKNIFIVTDGLEDDQIGPRTIGPVTNPLIESVGGNCAKLKALGFNVYVLYTPYYPLPNNFYLTGNAPDTPKPFVEPVYTGGPGPTNPVVQGLMACASKPEQFYQASSPSDIQAAMLEMLKSATSAPARISM